MKTLFSLALALFAFIAMSFCVSKWQTLKYHKKGISVDDSEYLPYSIMRNII